MEWKQVEGKDKGDIKIFALSTCIWCQKTKELLDTSKVAYRYVDVDHLDEASQEQCLQEMAKYAREASFPMVVVDEKKVILGFKKQEIRDALEK